jgi:hypothetical protein
MLILASTTDKLQVVTESTGAINVHASYLDNVAGSVNPGRQNTVISVVAITDVVAAPNSGVQRNVKTLHVNNSGTTNNTVTVQHTDGTVVAKMHRMLLPPDQTLQYIDEVGFLLASGGSLGFGGQTTGDAKLTLKTVADAGWVLMNDGSIGDSLSGGTARANDDCLNLFTLLWNNIANTWAPVSGGRGGSAASDWAAHKTIQLTRQLGRSLSIAGTGPGLTGRALGGFAGEETHAPTGAELLFHGHGVSDPTHEHPPRVLCENDPHDRHFVNDGGDGYALNDVFPSYTGIGIAGAGGSVPFNVLHPMSFWNIMIKL